MTATVTRTYTVSSDTASGLARKVAAAARSARSITGLSEDAFGMRVAREMGYDKTTRDQLSVKMGHTRASFIRNVESGFICPSAEALLAMAKVAGISVCSLLEEGPLDLNMMECRLARLES